MNRTCLRLILYGVLVACIMGCAAVDQFFKEESRKPSVSEEDIADDGGTESDTHSVRPAHPVDEVPNPVPDTAPAPAVSDAPDQSVEQSSTVTEPAERPRRRFIWSDRKGWAPGKSESEEDHP
jgi:hypothetical protein